MATPKQKQKLRQLYELYEQPMYRIAWAENKRRMLCQMPF